MTEVAIEVVPTIGCCTTNCWAEAGTLSVIQRSAPMSARIAVSSVTDVTQLTSNSAAEPLPAARPPVVFLEGLPPSAELLVGTRPGIVREHRGQVS